MKRFADNPGERVDVLGDILISLKQGTAGTDKPLLEILQGDMKIKEWFDGFQSFWPLKGNLRFEGESSTGNSGFLISNWKRLVSILNFALRMKIGVNWLSFSNLSKPPENSRIYP